MCRLTIRSMLAAVAAIAVATQCLHSRGRTPRRSHAARSPPSWRRVARSSSVPAPTVTTALLRTAPFATVGKELNRRSRGQLIEGSASSAIAAPERSRVGEATDTPTLPFEHHDRAAQPMPKMKDPHLRQAIGDVRALSVRLCVSRFGGNNNNIERSSSASRKSRALN